MRPLTGKELCSLLERHGWSLLRIHGSHHVYGKPGSR
ncbi:MAG TPA: type II toxin-antitoxin system HicA family toxin [Thermoanaerobaculia bacterium]|nr:type II toxin-antitoxin system HicA family toxin [Thermoanaerobaculia bacterium]